MSDNPDNEEEEVLKAARLIISAATFVDCCEHHDMDVRETLGCLATALGIAAMRAGIDWGTAQTLAVNNVVIKTIEQEEMILGLLRQAKGNLS